MALGMKIKNFHKFQIYKDRSPPWICLHRTLLEDPDWHDLSGNDAKLLVSLWLIASEDATREGILPCVRKLAFRLRVPEGKLSEALSRLEHWIVRDDTESYQLDTVPAVRGPRLCPDDYSPSESCVQTLAQEGHSTDSIARAVMSMRDWSRANDKRKKDWDAALRNWVRRDSERNRTKPTRTQAAMIEAMEEFK